MSTRIGILLCLIVAGLVVLAWPEENDLMMIQFSERHGPSTLDLIGLGILFTGYLPLIAPVFIKFSLVQSAGGKVFSRLLVVIAIACTLLIGISLVIGSDALLWIMVAIGTCAQGILIYFSVQKSEKKNA